LDNEDALGFYLTFRQTTTTTRRHDTLPNDTSPQPNDENGAAMMRSSERSTEENGGHEDIDKYHTFHFPQFIPSQIRFQVV